MIKIKRTFGCGKKGRQGALTATCGENGILCPDCYEKWKVERLKPYLEQRKLI